MKITTITVNQVNSDGKVFRTFSYYKFPWEVDSALERIELGFNMDRTKVTIS